MHFLIYVTKTSGYLSSIPLSCQSSFLCDLMGVLISTHVMNVVNTQVCKINQGVSVRNISSHSICHYNSNKRSQHLHHRWTQT